MPEIVGANTNVPAIAIGERASSFILDENEEEDEELASSC
jgi:choline dehydrogenase-like flavoprotein